METSHAGGKLYDMSLDGASLRGRRIVVVGAGALGACLSLRLAQAGAETTVVERKHPGSGTTQASFAWVNAFSKAPRWLYQLHVDALLAHERLRAEWDGDWLDVGGSLHWSSKSSPDEFDRLNRALEAMKKWGARVDELNADQLKRIEPDLDIEAIGEQTVYHITRGALVFGMRLAGFAVRACVREFGAQYRTGQVRRLTQQSGRVTGVQLEDGSQCFGDCVIVTAGTESADLVATAGARLRVVKKPGSLLVSAPTTANLRRIVMAPDVSLRSDGGGRIVIGSRELSASTPQIAGSADAETVVAALQRARAWVPALREAGIETIRHGVRPMPEDGEPIVGPDPDLAGLYHVAAHNAVTLAPLLAELVVGDMTGFSSEALRHFRPDRFASSTTG